MADRDVSFDLLARDKTASAIGSAERSLGKLDRAVRKSTDNLSRSTAQWGKVGARAGMSFAEEAITSIARSAGKVGPAGAAIGAAVGVAMAATAGAALTAGLLAAAGGGAVVAGITLALKDPRVKAVADATGKDIGDRLAKAAIPFRDVTIKALDTVSQSFGRVEGNVQRIFSTASSYVEPLVNGMTRAIERIAPAVERAVARAGPVIDAIGASLPEIGDAIADAFDAVTANGPEAVTFIRQMTMGFTDLIQGTGQLVSDLTVMYGQLVNAGSAAANFLAMLPVGQIPYVKDAIADIRELKGTLDEANGAGRRGAAGTFGFGESTAKAGAQASVAAAETEKLADKMRAAAHAALAASNSEIAMEQAIDDATAALKSNGRAHDINTEKGRANRSALNAVAAAALRARDDILAQTGSQRQASAAAERGRAKFLSLAAGMGMSASAARNLANKIFGIPSNKTVNVKANTAAALAAIEGFQKRIDSIRGKTVTVTTRFNRTGEYTPGQGTQVQFAAGDGFRQGDGATRRTGGPTVVNSNVGVSVMLDGAPFYAMTKQVVSDSERRQAYRNRVGRR